MCVNLSSLYMVWYVPHILILLLICTDLVSCFEFWIVTRKYGLGKKIFWIWSTVKEESIILMIIFSFALSFTKTLCVPTLSCVVLEFSINKINVLKNVTRRIWQYFHWNYLEIIVKSMCLYTQNMNSFISLL